MALAETVPTHDFHEAIEQLTPLLREHAEASARERRLAPPVADALRDAGFFRMLRPRSRGGHELAPADELRVAEALARVDAAAAWNVQVCNASELYGGWFGDEATEEIFAPAETIACGSFNPHRRAVAVDGGYRLSGQTPFNSGCHAATWVIGLADVYDGDTMRVDADGQPTVLLTAIPAREIEIVPNWETMGMSGTGSHDIRVVDVFVPAARAVPFGPLSTPSPAYDNGLARSAVWVTVGCHAAVALGIAQAAVDDLLELGRKVPSYTTKSLRDRATVQLRLAQAEAKLGSARAFFYEAFETMWGAVTTRGSLTQEEKARCQLAGSFAVTSSAEVVELVHSCVGTSGIRSEQRFERYFRDVHVITQHAFVAEARMEAVGQIELGLEPDWGFFAF